MSFLRENKDGYALLKIDGPMTVNETASIRDELIECLVTYNGLILDLDAVSECDTAGIQLLCSARLTAKETGKSFSVTSASMSSMNTLVRAGFDPDAILMARNEH